MKSFKVEVLGKIVEIFQDTDNKFIIPQELIGGTALKPAQELFTLARKPLAEKTIAMNVLEWGTGGLNIDESRVPTDDNLNGGAYAKTGIERDDGWGMQRAGAGEYVQPVGRFPANVIHDGSDEVEEEFAKVGKLKSGSNNTRQQEGFFMEHGGLGKKGDVQVSYGDSGSASRFFYCAKASKSERGETNNHPTVKPLKLMEYLVNLITPKEGIVLDPFIGSGTTALACINKNFKFIGIERELDYCKIIESRINDKTK